MVRLKMADQLRFLIEWSVDDIVRLLTCYQVRTYTGGQPLAAGEVYQTPLFRTKLAVQDTDIVFEPSLEEMEKVVLSLFDFLLLAADIPQVGPQLLFLLELTENFFCE